MKNKNILEFIIKTIKGLIVGVGFLTAGAGTFAIILGIYDKCMEIIAKPFKNFKENIIYICPILLGILISVLIFKNIVTILFNNYESYTKCVFFGIMLGGIPSLVKVANKKGKSKFHIIAFFGAFILTLIFTYLGSKFGNSSEIDSKMEPFHLFIYGGIYAFGAIMPGMTTMHILIFLGVWAPIIKEILSINFSVLIPFGIGYLLIILLFANLMSFCFERFYGYTYYAIIGFSITSLVMLVPRINSFFELIICTIFVLSSTFIMYKISKLEDRIREKENSILE